VCAPGLHRLDNGLVVLWGGELGALEGVAAGVGPERDRIAQRLPSPRGERGTFGQHNVKPLNEVAEHVVVVAGHGAS